MGARGQRAPRRPCEAPECTRDAVAKGLCLTHYKRARAGKSLVPPPGPRKGDPDGFGVYGDLSDDGETVQCHECGHRGAYIGSHVYSAHEMTARDYKIAHGLPLSRGLMSAQARAEHRERSRDSEGSIRALERHRDPLAASQSRDMDVVRAGARHRDPQVSRANGLATRRGDVRVCPICREVSWCTMAGAHRTVTCSLDCWREWQRTSGLDPDDVARRAERDAEIRAGWQAGESARTLADRYDLTPQHVRVIVRGAGA